MTRKIVNPRRGIQEIPPKERKGIYQGKLAEDYDGIGQYILVNLSSSSVGGAYTARIASGDFGTGQTFPAGTPVSVASTHGKLEVLSLGTKAQSCCATNYASIGVSADPNPITITVEEGQLANISMFDSTSILSVTTVSGDSPTYFSNGFGGYLLGNGVYTLTFTGNGQVLITVAQLGSYSNNSGGG